MAKKAKKKRRVLTVAEMRQLTKSFAAFLVADRDGKLSRKKKRI